MKISLINAESEPGPLCRSYVCAVFDVLKLRIQGDTGVHAIEVLWGVGILSDYRQHYLGAWHVHDARGVMWCAIAGDVQDRGIERLRIVIGPDPVEIQAAMAPRYRYCTALPASGTLVHPEMESTLSGHRPYVERALEVTGSLTLRLKRAAARHGPFADTVAGAALLRRSAEHCISRDWPEPLAPACALRTRTATALTAAVS